MPVQQGVQEAGPLIGEGVDRGREAGIEGCDETRTECRLGTVPGVEEPGHGHHSRHVRDAPARVAVVVGDRDQMGAVLERRDGEGVTHPPACRLVREVLERRRRPCFAPDELLETGGGDVTENRPAARRDERIRSGVGDVTLAVEHQVGRSPVPDGAEDRYAALSGRLQVVPEYGDGTRRVGQEADGPGVIRQGEQPAGRESAGREITRRREKSPVEEGVPALFRGIGEVDVDVHTLRTAATMLTSSPHSSTAPLGEGVTSAVLLV